MKNDGATSRLDTFPDEQRSRIENALSKGPFIPAGLVDELTAELRIGVAEFMIALLPAAASHARVPISSFPVGAIALAVPTGNLYLGANMEFTGHALSASVHGEQAASNNAWLHGEEGLQAVAVNEVPCGYCRQFLNELTTSASLRIMLRAEAHSPADYAHSSKPLSHYLQDSFGPTDLGVTGGLMGPQAHGMSVESPDQLALQALDAANASYSPYTSNFAGVAIRTGAGKTYVGRYAENAAFNPSMSPLQSALASLNMHEPAHAPYDIEAVVLVEPADSKISQLSVTEAVLSSVAPDVQLRHLLVR